MNKRILVITEYVSPSLVDRVKRISKWKSDHSISIVCPYIDPILVSVCNDYSQNFSLEKIKSVLEIPYSRLVLGTIYDSKILKELRLRNIETVPSKMMEKLMKSRVEEMKFFKEVSKSFQNIKFPDTKKIKYEELISLFKKYKRGDSDIFIKSEPKRSNGNDVQMVGYNILTRESKINDWKNDLQTEDFLHQEKIEGKVVIFPAKMIKGKIKHYVPISVSYLNSHKKGKGIWKKKLLAYSPSSFTPSPLEKEIREYIKSVSKKFCDDTHVASGMYKFIISEGKAYFISASFDNSSCYWISTRPSSDPSPLDCNSSRKSIGSRLWVWVYPLGFPEEVYDRRSVIEIKKPYLCEMYYKGCVPILGSPASEKWVMKKNSYCLLTWISDDKNIKKESNKMISNCIFKNVDYRDDLKFESIK